ncbi:hypothetical protein BGX29_005732 [Mortierella sp. GBA35]|nr:hypothetical protein BGX29_005732 [Mortierella sp. GBA35]
MSTPVYQWLQCCVSFNDTPHQYQPFADRQEQYEPYSPYLQILNDSDKALLATIHLGPGSTDYKNTSTPSPKPMAIADHISMYDTPLIPAALGSYPAISSWDPECPDGFNSPVIRCLTPIPEVTNDSYVLIPSLSDNHNHRQGHSSDDNNSNTTDTDNLTPNVTLLDQETPPPMGLHHHHHYHLHHQYGAVDQFSAAFYDLSHLYHPLSLSPSVSPPPFSTSSSSSSNTPFSSPYPPTSPSLSSTSGCNSPYGSPLPSIPESSGQSLFAAGFEQHLNPPNWSSSRPFASRSSSIMTRRRSQQALLSSKSLLSPSYPSPITTRRQSQAKASMSSFMAAKPLPLSRLVTAPKLHSSKRSRSSPLNPSGVEVSLTCHVCKKEYANNSTLRRHLKIHAYASTSAVTRTANVFPSTAESNSAAAAAPGAASASALGSSSADSNSDPSMSSSVAAVNSHLLSSFWPVRDLPNPNLSTTIHRLQMVTSGYNPGSDPAIKKPECVGCNKSFARRDTVILHIKNQKRKWDQLCTMLPALAASLGPNEKLWQSTLQKKRLQFGPYSRPGSSSSKSRCGASQGGDDDEGTDEDEDEEDERDGGDGDNYEENLGRFVEGEDGWPSQEVLDAMDNQTKLQWMVKMAVVPPCWRERKVRSFGAFGTLEETVL